VWLGFKGGKGVATLLGILFALAWPVGLIAALVWVGMLALSRISSVGGMSAAISAPISAAFLGRWDLLPLFASLAVLVLWTHRANIQRLANGTEPRVGSRD
jgi:glycerol-3-phosphate acyltransferase PlsY